MAIRKVCGRFFHIPQKHFLYVPCILFWLWWSILAYTPLSCKLNYGISSFLKAKSIQPQAVQCQYPELTHLRLRKKDLTWFGPKSTNDDLKTSPHRSKQRLCYQSETAVGGILAMIGLPRLHLHFHHQSTNGLNHTHCCHQLHQPVVNKWS